MFGASEFWCRYPLLLAGVCVAIGPLTSTVYAQAEEELVFSVPDEPRPEIDIWYGQRQQFGALGDPQPLLNILGSVAHAEVVGDASYGVNGGRRLPLVIGGDLHRLALPGDFNIEIDRSKLSPGENQVDIRVRSLRGQDATATVTVDYAPGNRWPLPFEVNWSEVERIQDVAEVVDGRWELTENGVRTAAPYYDRVLAFGDSSWKDYEVVVDVVYHKIFGDHEGRNLEGPPYLNHTHASLGLRWNGHPRDGWYPRREWRNIGGLVALRADVQHAELGSRWWLHFSRKNLEPEPIQLFAEERIQIVPETTYRYRARVETLSDERSRYSMKVWEASEPEPEGWDLQGVDNAENVTSGCLLFIVHHSDVTYGNLKVIPVEATPESLWHPPMSLPAGGEKRRA